MAFLYRNFAAWRILVYVTRDRRILAAVTLASVAGAGAIASKTQSITDSSAEKTREELESLRKRDIEVDRYARHSEEALAKMFDQVRGESSDSENTASQSIPGKPPIKMPGVAWHPKAVEREKRAEREAEKQQEK